MKEVFNSVDYAVWRHNRLSVLLTWVTERFGHDWFAGKRILELGAGNGHIGAELTLLGADVWILEGRTVNIDLGRELFPFVPADRWVGWNLEWGWPDHLGDFDLILHWGTLYHLGWWKESLVGAMTHAPILSLETEVCDSKDVDLVVPVQEDRFKLDQSMGGVGARLSVAHVESMIDWCGMQSQRLDLKRLNSVSHKYDWRPSNSGKVKGGALRRFWMCWRHDALYGPKRVSPVEAKQVEDDLGEGGPEVSG